MSLLTIVQDVCKRLGLAVPSAVVGSTDKNVLKLLALLEEGGRDVRQDYIWPQLTRTHTFTLTAADDTYAYPADFDYILNRTTWDRTNSWPLNGPVDNEEWEREKSGVSITGPRRKFRAAGFGTLQFTLHPVPDAGDTGSTYAYQYQSLWWIAAAAGTTPVKEAFTVDTDVVFFKEELLKKELYWRWRRSIRVSYVEEQIETKRAWAKEALAYRGTQAFNLAGKTESGLLSYKNIPESGYG